MAEPCIKIFVCLHSWYYFKNFSDVFHDLHRRGHRLSIYALVEDREDFRRAVEAFRDDHAGLEIGMAPARGDGWSMLTWSLRQTLGFLHFLDPRFDGMPRLRGRMAKRAASKLQELALSPGYRRGPRAWLLRRIARRFEQAIPADQVITDFIARDRPDIMILSPLIDLDGAQWDYLKSAKELGIPTVFPVYSWDNLSSKTHLFNLPDRILVWNRRQIDEAVRYHRTPRRRVRATGAQSFDEWFERKPSIERAAFCADLGLDPDKPLILYVGSATTRRDMPESAFTLRWLEALRHAEEPAVRDANVIIRPHPKREHIWDEVDLGGFGAVVVHPARGQLPIGEQAKRVYFDSLHHCDLVVGLNTSALIEAGIVGRPVFTVLDPAFAVDQTETFHFPYLLDASEGLLAVAKDFGEHARQIAEALEHPEVMRGRAKAFVGAFVRPNGLEEAAVPRFVEEILALATVGIAPARVTLLDRILRRRMAPFVFNPRHLRFESGKLKKLVLARDKPEAQQTQA